MIIFTADNPEETVKPPEGTIILAHRGSVAHGLYVKPEDENSTDDIDILGLVVPGPEYIIGLQEWGSRGTKEEWVGRYDCVYYSIHKAFRMLLQGNPNIVSMLWNRPDGYISLEKSGRDILACRDWFLSQHLYHSFSGYAWGQFVKMTRKSNEVPTGYMGAKRKAVAEKYGYDTRNAAHCIRLMKMCLEVMETGVMNVRRDHDRDELLAIKNGKWPLVDVLNYARDLFEKAKVDKEKSVLPPEPNREETEQLLMDIVLEHLQSRRVV